MNELEFQVRRFEEDKKFDEKENFNQNDNRSKEEILKRYDMAKRLCTMRNETIEKLNKEISGLRMSMENMEQMHKSDIEKLNRSIEIHSKNFEIMKAKYDHAKVVCETRQQKINELRERIGEKSPIEAM